MENHSALQLGSDGSYGCILLPFTNRQLSERIRFRTVFVTAFFCIADTVTCASAKVKCFSLVDLKIFILPIFPWKELVKLGNLPVDKSKCLWLNDRNAYRKDNDGNFACFGCSREPVVGVNRCRRLRQSDSRVGSVNSPWPSNGTRIPPLQG